MSLLVLLILAFVLGYWLSRSRYHLSIDKAATTAVHQPKKWWERLVHRPAGDEPIVENSNQAFEKES